MIFHLTGGGNGGGAEKYLGGGETWPSPPPSTRLIIIAQPLPIQTIEGFSKEQQILFGLLTIGLSENQYAKNLLFCSLGGTLKLQGSMSQGTLHTFFLPKKLPRFSDLLNFLTILANLKRLYTFHRNFKMFSLFRS